MGGDLNRTSFYQGTGFSEGELSNHIDIVWRSHDRALPTFHRKRTFVGPDGRQYRWDTHYRDVSVSIHDAFGLLHVV